MLIKKLNKKNKKLNKFVITFSRTAIDRHLHQHAYMHVCMYYRSRSNKKKKTKNKNVREAKRVGIPLLFEGEKRKIK